MARPPFSAVGVPGVAQPSISIGSPDPNTEKQAKRILTLPINQYIDKKVAKDVPIDQKFKQIANRPKSPQIVSRTKESRTNRKTGISRKKRKIREEIKISNQETNYDYIHMYFMISHHSL